MEDFFFKSHMKLLERKNTISKMKISLDRLNSILKIAKEKISIHDDIIEAIKLQHEEKKD